MDDGYIEAPFLQSRDQGFCALGRIPFDEDNMPYDIKILKALKYSGSSMRTIWRIRKRDVKRLQGFFDRHKDNPFVKNRIERNIRGLASKVTRRIFRERIIDRLLTT